MSEIKPCMNDGCGMWGNYCNGLNCGTSEDNPKTCSKYTDTPPPKPFTPKNPDDYLPGCRKGKWETCELGHDSGAEYKCWCCCAPWEPSHDDLKIRNHKALCETIPCYDPAPKPKTRDYMIVKFNVEHGFKDTDYMLAGLRSDGYSPETCEIITEEIPNE